MREFVPPPEAPVFEPTAEEFKDPLAYINQIRPIAERSGICKIRPPPNWKPPFSVDVSSFRFTPRIQHLNELEATTRVKLNFLDAVAKYWELQGTTMKLPTVEGAPLDLLKLWKVVNEMGGFETATHDKRWTQISHKMGYTKWQQLGFVLRQHYEKILYPYCIFRQAQGLKDGELNLSGSQNGFMMKSSSLKRETRTAGAATVAMSTSCSSMSTRQKSKQSSRMGSLSPTLLPENMNKKNMRELKKLQFLSPGPKMSKLLQPDGTVGPHVKTENGGLCAATVEGNLVGHELKEEPVVTKKRDVEVKKEKVENGKYYQKQQLDVDNIFCLSCCRGDEEASMLLCDKCDASYHIFCLVPPLKSVPAGDWRCPKCLAEECNKKHGPFGFEQASKTYTLQTFGQMANCFKVDYFEVDEPRSVPPQQVEKEFWRAVHSIEDDVAVEYGADLLSSEHGSGFPVSEEGRLEADSYVQSAWNLNNMPNLEASVLRHITADISGMKVPWVYVGMCFSSFCWHNEDHWSYSINYLHWGEPKTWYGIPGSRAESFEKIMHEAVPELFDECPDLLHHLVTLISPMTLMDSDIPVVRTNQCAGEFVVTFPRAYHAGFNCGYNFAEAVNFAPADWLPFGRACMEHYRQLRRYTVFAHDELVCKMAMKASQLDLRLASLVYDDMKVMVQKEEHLRRQVLEDITESEREALELLPDDERQCQYCQALCFLSAITCPCSPGKLVCLYHASDLCECRKSQQILKYRYTLSELPAMLQRVKLRADSYATWSQHVRQQLDSTGDERPTLQELKAMLKEAHEANFCSSPGMMEEVEKMISEAERCNVAINHLLTGRRRTRRKSDRTLHVDELEQLVEQVAKLRCRIDDSSLRTLMASVEELRSAVRRAIAEPQPSVLELTNLRQRLVEFEVTLPEIALVEQGLQHLLWLDEAKAMLEEKSHNKVPLETLRRLISSGRPLVEHAGVEETVKELQEMVLAAEDWKVHINAVLQEKISLNELERMWKEAEDLSVEFPALTNLREKLDSVYQWRMEVLAAEDKRADLETAIQLLTSGHDLKVQLKALTRLDSKVSLAKSWLARMSSMFCRKSTNTPLLQLLCPRTGGTCDQKVMHETWSCTDYERSRALDVQEERAQLIKLAKAELDNIRHTREEKIFNVEGDRRYGASSSSYCTCLCQLSEKMVRCELCYEWFHVSCLQKRGAQPPVAGSKFICSLCKRSSRPHIETVMSELANLEKVAFTLVPGTALRYLVERAVTWQARACQSIHQTLELIQQRHPSMADSLRQVGVGLSSVLTLSRLAPDSGCVPSNGFAPITTYKSPRGLQNLQSVNATSLLSPEVCAHLEELMMEGDILEVTIPETEQLWQLLQMAGKVENSFYFSANNGLRAEKRVGDPLAPPADKKPRMTEIIISDDDSASEEDDGPCAAEHCRLPEEDHVEWVQCDLCQGWYHFVCLDLDSNYIRRLESYSCDRCLNKSNTPVPSSVSLLGSSQPVCKGYQMPSLMPVDASNEHLSTP